MLFLFVHDMSASSPPVPGIPGPKERSMSHSHFLSSRSPRPASALTVIARTGSFASWCLSSEATCEPFHKQMRNKTFTHPILPPRCRVRHARPPGALCARSWHSQLVVSDAASRSQDREKSDNVYMRPVTSEEVCVTLKCYQEATNQYRIPCNPADNSLIL